MRIHLTLHLHIFQWRYGPGYKYAFPTNYEVHQDHRELTSPNCTYEPNLRMTLQTQLHGDSDLYSRRSLDHLSPAVSSEQMSKKVDNRVLTQNTRIEFD